jgi:hypothetical protein
MPGDGQFFWWWGAGAEPETYTGPCDSRETAISEARDEEDDRGFTVVEADRSVARSDIFRADRVLEDYMERNEECWGEDWPEIEATKEQRRELEQALTAALDGWFAQHGLKPKTWAFHTQQNEEYFAPVDGPAEQ